VQNEMTFQVTATGKNLNWGKHNQLIEIADNNLVYGITHNWIKEKPIRYLGKYSIKRYATLKMCQCKCGVELK